MSPPKKTKTKKLISPADCERRTVNLGLLSLTKTKIKL